MKTTAEIDIEESAAHIEMRRGNHETPNTSGTKPFATVSAEHGLQEI
jgi:hypothetical protein